MAETVAPCSAGFVASEPGAPAPSVHGDPMFKVNGSGVHFWLAEGELTPLLVAGEVTLSGKTFARQSTGNQWFDKFVVSQKGAPVLEVSTLNGVTQVKLDGAIVQTGTHKAKGVEINFAETGIHAKAEALAIRIYSSGANKYAAAKDKAEYGHLNINFEGGIPPAAKGIFAELAGVAPMSDATASLLKPPGRSVHRGATTLHSGAISLSTAKELACGAAGNIGDVVQGEQQGGPPAGQPCCASMTSTACIIKYDFGPEPYYKCYADSLPSYVIHGAPSKGAEDDCLVAAATGGGGITVSTIFCFRLT